MTADEALAVIRRAAIARRLVYTRHSEQEMAEANATREDVRNALVHALSCKASHQARWKLEGPDLDGDDLAVVVVIEDDVVVVTVM